MKQIIIFLTFFLIIGGVTLYINTQNITDYILVKQLYATILICYIGLYFLSIPNIETK